jgi:YggT family protein
MPESSLPALFVTLLQVLEIVLIADAVLSWVLPNKEQFPRSLTSQITDPLCAPFRKLLGGDRMGGFDFSPLIVLIVLQIMRGMLVGAL